MRSLVTGGAGYSGSHIAILFAAAGHEPVTFDDQAINLGTGRGHSVREVVDTVARASGRTVPAVESGRRPGGSSELVAAPVRARNVLDWTCQYAGLETIVRHACAWHKKHLRRTT
jgi:UDP-glucose 4-epimerase